MQHNSLTDRVLPRIVRDICTAHDIEYASFSDDWVLRLKKADIMKWIVGPVFDINPAASAYLANDKVGCYLALRDAGIPAAEHYLVRSSISDIFISPPDSLTNVVAKPLSGSGGVGVMPFDTVDAARQYVMQQPTGDWALCPRYDIASEYRYIVLDGRIILTYQKTHPRNNDGLPMFNLSRGAVAQIVTVDPTFEQLALRAQSCLGLRLSAVDIAKLADGSRIVMEVNQGFGMNHFARQSEEYYQKTHRLYEAIIMTMLA